MSQMKPNYLCNHNLVLSQLNWGGCKCRQTQLYSYYNKSMIASPDICCEVEQPAAYSWKVWREFMFRRFALRYVRCCHHFVHNRACNTCFPSHHHFDLFQEVILSSVGQGPTVHVQSSQLDFGKIRVLTDSTRLLQLLNQSPIPASFTARMVQTRIGAKWNRVECLEFQFRIEPAYAYITQELFDVRCFDRRLNRLRTDSVSSDR